MYVASLGRMVVNIIGTTDFATSTAPTNEWIENHGMDELELPLLSMRNEIDEAPVRFRMTTQSERSEIDDKTSSDSAQMADVPVAQGNSKSAPVGDIATSEIEEVPDTPMAIEENHVRDSSGAQDGWQGEEGITDR